MFSAVFGSVEQGIIYAIMALGVYITFRVLDFPDLNGGWKFCNRGSRCGDNDCLWLSSAIGNGVRDCHWIYCGLY